MDLLIQFQSIIYSVLFGFVMTGVYHIINRFLFKLFYILRVILQVGLGLGFGFLYFQGLVWINDGILRIYYFFCILIGYLFYQKYYAFYLLYYLEYVISFFKRILSPFIFFFRRISVIIQKSIRKVKKRWQRQKRNQDMENS